MHIFWKVSDSFAPVRGWLFPCWTLSRWWWCLKEGPRLLSSQAPRGHSFAAGRTWLEIQESWCGLESPAFPACFSLSRAKLGFHVVEETWFRGLTWLLERGLPFFNRRGCWVSRTDKASGCHQPAASCSLPASGGAGADLLLSTPGFVGGRVSSVHFKGCQKNSPKISYCYFSRGIWTMRGPLHPFHVYLSLMWVVVFCVCVCVCVFWTMRGPFHPFHVYLSLMWVVVF